MSTHSFHKEFKSRICIGIGLRLWNDSQGFRRRCHVDVLHRRWRRMAVAWDSLRVNDEARIASLFQRITYALDPFLHFFSNKYNYCKEVE